METANPFITQKKNVKHYRHLRYLASKHEGLIGKLRIVLDPFSFVFLLSGAEHERIRRWLQENDRLFAEV